MPAVSVILAFHRVTPFLPLAVQSLIEQTFSDWELLLVDDGAGVGLAPLGSAGADSRIRLITLPANQGIAAAHNAAVALAQGEFIAMMDYDDISLPSRLERQVAALRAEPALGLLFTHAATVDEAGQKVGSQFTLASEREHREFSAYAMPATSPTLMGRREVFAALPMRPTFRIGPDYDFLARAVERWPSRALPDVLFHYRRHAGQTSEQSRARHAAEIACVRLMTGLRRQNRQPFEPVVLLNDSAFAAAQPADVYAEAARRALAFDLPLLAAHFARKEISERRMPMTWWRGISTVRAAGRSERGAGEPRWRMFFTGPLRTHGLVPLA